jgi:RimJ/RimL family protein N-acetyltransferase
MRNIQTARLVIRAFEYRDCDFIIRLLNEPSFIQNVEDKGVRTRAQAAVFLTQGPMASHALHGHGLCLVALKDSGQPIGMCGLLLRQPARVVDLGYGFLPEFWGQGYALEAAAAMLDFGRRQLGLLRASAIVAPDNARSIALLEKLGFTFSQWLPVPDAHGTVAEYARPLSLQDPP